MILTKYSFVITKFVEKFNHPFPFSFFVTLIFVELSIFRTSPVHILRNQGGGGGGQKDYTITGGRGGGLKYPRKMIT